jgi:hypothetical protein
VKSRRSLTAAVAVVAVLGLGACAGGQPGARRLTEDMIESLDADQSVKDCMYAVVDTYTEDELEQMGEENPQFNSADPDLESATPEFRELYESMESCETPG